MRRSRIALILVLTTAALGCGDATTGGVTQGPPGEKGESGSSYSCSDWSNGTANVSGTIINATSTPVTAACNVARSVACCQ